MTTTRKLFVAMSLAAVVLSGAAAESTPERIDRGAIPLAPAERGVQVQLEQPPPAPGPPAPARGDCGSWRAVFAWYGASDGALRLFFGSGPPWRAVIWRETRCGLDVVNESTGDWSICQLNPVHNRPGYVNGRNYPGGWLADLFGLQVRRDDPWSVRWVPACLWLHEQLGSAPWKVTR